MTDENNEKADNNKTLSYSERGKMGGRPQQASDDDILNAVCRVLAETDAPVVRTADVSERLPIGEQATRDRLSTLVVRGQLRSLSVGSGKVWWLDEQSDNSDTNREDSSPVFRL